ncbi:hypothetical protein KIPB_003592, partial [Kipferlia bialata]
ECICVPTQNPSFDTDASSYVCPVNAEGAYQLEWLVPLTEEEYPTTYEGYLELTLLRRFWPVLPEDTPNIGYDGVAVSSSWRVLYFVYFNYGFIALLLFARCAYEAITDPDFSKARAKMEKKRDKIRAKRVPSDATLWLWERHDRNLAMNIEKIRQSDRAKQSFINVTALRGMLSRPTTPMRGGESATGQEKLPVESEGRIVGGIVTVICKNAAIVVATVLMFIVFYSPIVALPSSLTGSLPMYAANQRVVDTVPMASLTPMERMLAEWAEANDSLYVTEVLGGDWGTQCLDYELVRDLPLSSIVELMYVSSTGALPVSVQSPQPTTVGALREAGSFSVTTEGCTLFGSDTSCDSAFSTAFDPLNNPLAAYGCYVDDGGTYHHLNMVSSGLLAGFAEGSDVSYHIEWSPSEAFPLFGLKTPAAIKIHVFPASTALMFIQESIFDDGDTTVASRLSRYEQEVVLKCSVQRILGLSQEDGYSECYDADGQLLYPNISLFGDDISGNNTWDASREVSKGIAPVPESVTSPTTRYSCTLNCSDTNSCSYTGEYCKELQAGVALGSDESTMACKGDDDQQYDFGQPDGVLCPQQSFSVSSQRTLVTGCRDNPSMMGLCRNTGHYGAVYDTLEGSPAICRGDSSPSTASPLSVTISRTMEDAVTRVDFTLPGFVKVLSTLFVVGVELFSLHALTLKVIEMASGRLETRRARKAWQNDRSRQSVLRVMPVELRRGYRDRDTYPPVPQVPQ